MKFLIRLAERIIEIHSQYDSVKTFCRDYLCSDQTGPDITVTITNDNVEELMYGEMIGPLFVKLDGKWYQVPVDVSMGNMMYTAIGYLLSPGSDAEVTNPFGYLPNGEYAVFVSVGTKGTGVFEYDLAEFTV